MHNAYVQFGLALLRPPIIFDQLGMPKIHRLINVFVAEFC